MYRYTESGLENVWLANGYKQRGDAVAIEDSDSLHRAIGRVLARKPRLNGQQLRYLRKELGLSQARLGNLLDVSEESVSLWERRGRVPQSAARVVQAMYLEVAEGGITITQLVKTLAEMDDTCDEPMVFAHAHNQGWLNRHVESALV